MDHDEAKLRFKNLHSEGQLRVLATFGHELTIVARDTYESQALGVRAAERLRAAIPENFTFQPFANPRTGIPIVSL